MVQRFHDIYKVDAPLAAFQDVYKVDASGVNFRDVYQVFAGDPAPAPAHPPTGEYIFTYHGDVGGGRGPSSPVPLDGYNNLRLRMPAGIRPTEAQMRQVLTTDAGCKAIEFMQRYPYGDSWPGGTRTTPRQLQNTWRGVLGNGNDGTANLRFIFLDYSQGWARGQIGNLYWLITGHSFNARGPRQHLDWRQLRLRMEEANSPPDWWAVPHIGSWNVDGVILIPSNTLVWAWEPGGNAQDWPNEEFGWYDCQGLYHHPPRFRDIYKVDAPLTAFQDVYRVDADFAIFHDVYRVDANPSGFQDVYKVDAPVAGFQDVYQVDAPIGRGLTGFQDVYKVDAPVAAVPRFQDVYEVNANPQRGPHFQDVYRVHAALGDTTTIVDRGDRGPLTLGDELMRASVRIGRSEASHLARVLPMQMLLTVDNRSGNYGPDQITPQNKINFSWRGILMGAGWVTRVQTDTDHDEGLSIAHIRVEGAFDRLARTIHELSLFITETARTGQIMDDALDQAGWDAAQRRISRGQVRLHPAHYRSVLAGRRIHQALPVMRAMEEAEIGLLHEGRGDTPTFEHRFFRELDTRDPVFRFGVLEGAIPVERTAQAIEEWDNVYSVVQVGAERAVVQADRAVWELLADLPLRAGESFIVDLLDEDDAGVRNPAVRSVIAWSPLEADHVEGIRVSLDRRTRTRTRVTALETGTLTKLELHARGIGLYGNLAIPERADPEAVALYGRRVLNLPKSFIGDGTNFEGDAIAEGRAQADLLLYRLSRPPIHGRLPVNPGLYEEVARDLAISDPVSCDSSTGLSPGIYHTEGWEFHWDADDAQAEMIIDVSRRPRRALVANTPLSYVASSDDWQNVGQAVALSATHPTVFGLDVHLPPATPSDDDDEVLRLIHGPETVRVWTLQDIPADVVGHPLAAVIAAGSGTGRFQARRQRGFSIRATRLRVSQMGVVSSPI